MEAGRSGLDSTLRTWLTIVHKIGCEVSVTLIVSGKQVTGLLAPMQRYAEWQSEVTHRAMRNRGNFALPSTKLPPISAEQSASIAERWKELESDPDGLEELFSQLCIRNAHVLESPAMYSWEMPFLLVAVEHVAAFALGGPPPAEIGPGDFRP